MLYSIDTLYSRVVLHFTKKKKLSGMKWDKLCEVSSCMFLEDTICFNTPYIHFILL